MNMISAGRKTWCQRIKAAIILEGVILLMAAFILWENTAGTGGKTVTATSVSYTHLTLPTNSRV